MTFPYIEIWDRLLIQFAMILDDSRWTITNFTLTKVEICENLISTIQPLLQYAACIEYNECMYEYNILCIVIF